MTMTTTTTETRKYKWVEQRYTCLLTPPPLPLSQAYSPAPQFAPQFVHIPQSKAKKGLIGISRRVSKSLFCFAVFFGPTPLPGGCPGVAGQVFQFFGLIAGSEYKEHRKKSTALPGYQNGSCNPCSVSLSVAVHMACIGCLPVRQLPSLTLCSALAWILIVSGLVGVYLNMSPPSLSVPKIHLYLEIPFWWTRRFRVCLQLPPAQTLWHPSLFPCFNVIAKNIVPCSLSYIDSASKSRLWLAHSSSGKNYIASRHLHVFDLM